MTSAAFAQLAAQRFSTTSRDPNGAHDAGVGVDGGHGPIDGGPTALDAAIDGGTERGDGGASRPMVSGCGCSATRAGATPAALLVALALAWRRSRRR